MSKYCNLDSNNDGILFILHSTAKTKRRKRNDPKNRNYLCGCGKAYLSYPALYTHIK